MSVPMTATCLKVFMDCYKQEITKYRMEDNESIVNKAHFAYKVVICAVQLLIFLYLSSAAPFSLKLWNIFITVNVRQ